MFQNQIKLSHLFACLFISAFLVSCQEDDGDGNDGGSQFSGLLVLNEGGFQKGNSSLSRINTTEKTVENGLFTSVNGGKIGDTGHSLSEDDQYIYMVVNNSGMVRVLDKATLVEKGTIEGFVSPREIVKVDDDKAYVTNLFGNNIDIVDLGSMSISSSIKLRGSCEKMVFVKGKLWITNNANKHVFVFDPAQDQLIDSIDVGGYSNEIHEMDGSIVVIRNSGDSTDGAFVRINGGDMTIESTTTFPTASKMWAARSTKSSTEVILLMGNTALRYSNDAYTELSLGNEFTPYNIHFFGGELWLTDAKDFQQDGTVHSLSIEGTYLEEYQVGWIPSDMLWVD